MGMRVCVLFDSKTGKSVLTEFAYNQLLLNECKGYLRAYFDGKLIWISSYSIDAWI